MRKGIHDAGARSVALNDQPVLRVGLNDVIQYELARADCLIADLSTGNPNVYFEIGVAQALGKRAILCINGDAATRVPSDLQAYFTIEYRVSAAGLAQLSAKLAGALRDIRRLPRRVRQLPAARYAAPFSVDWDKLESAEAENLCRELLAQMGYQRVDWAKETPEIDLIAELAKKDPDGFEYRELWLVSMGRNAPPEMLVHEADYILHRLFRRSERLSQRLSSRYANGTTTMLLILLRGDLDPEGLERLRARINEEGSYRFKGRDGPFGGGFRFRLWDRAYLTSLVQQFPQIGYKYFSDEGRAKSKYRKSADELYAETVELSARQAKLIKDLEDVKNRRVRAERDAIWKDISFSAAHKIGNPIFAIETDLGPLNKRVREARQGEALDVVKNIQASVEKAKAIIDQFKSLANAQKLNLISTLLKPILNDAMRVPQASGVDCTVDCQDHLRVQADPERLGECFDELAINCTHWLDKPDKVLSVVAAEAEVLPSGLDSSLRYAVIHFRDNGTGVPLENKDKIFDAFFTTYAHGTGLGLALVRRIIDGHHGSICEAGKPGQGADFEIYLPLAADSELGQQPAKRVEKKRKSATGTRKKHGRGK